MQRLLCAINLVSVALQLQASQARVSLHVDPVSILLFSTYMHAFYLQQDDTNIISLRLCLHFATAHTVKVTTKLLLATVAGDQQTHTGPTVFSAVYASALLCTVIGPCMQTARSFCLVFLWLCYCSATVAVFAATAFVAGRVYASSAGGFSLPAIVKGFAGNLKDLFTPKTLVSEFTPLRSLL